MKDPVTLLTFSGRDQPGITSQMTRILADHSIPIQDIAQSVVHGLLSLSILAHLPENPDEPLKELLFHSTKKGLKFEYQQLSAKELAAFQPSHPRSRYAVTLLAPHLSSQALADVSEWLASRRLNIDFIQRLSEENFSCLEMLVSSQNAVDTAALKSELLQLARKKGIDIALQAEGLFRRVKRLIVLDMDSTVIQHEVIDEFAREMGVFDAVSTITHSAMSGEIDYDESLRRRCALLKGLTLEQVERVYARIELTPGAEDLLQILKRLGYKLALLSGGFTLVSERIKQRLGFDYAYANTLIFEDGKATGEVRPPIVNAQRKADLLDMIAQQEKIEADQVIAVGDGANDILMIERAGLGIAFNAKASVREKAHCAINQRNLTSLLHVLGLSTRDIREALASP